MRLGWLDCGRLANFLERMCECAPEELETKTLIFLQGVESDLYDPPAPLFGDQVNSAFPSSVGEIEEAGKCLSLDRWTAAVMHLMRALEPVIQALQVSVDVEKPKEQWGQILDQIESKLKIVKKSTHGKENQQWCSEVAAQFRYIKDAWRNYAAHGHERYDKERAMEIYNATRGLMRQVATRLAE